ncbi:undecaprenyl-diphosphatase [Oikeobacillus pervagus]|uniref:Undecaprenyl-diphosphatase n=1 Tax=Oikeobacillus pervagus TaxID=1325931 RepID=A0AAJ1WKR0_9BACI|nr:phosphatase PAP2 family protein [Oikeobacillus pervagus]MDQ0215401.1 undecaprenyl-diphosphatase [Oikeobacillus pervagus]
MERAKSWFIKQDQAYFYFLNRRSKLCVSFFKHITHLGGAMFTIGLQLILLMSSNQTLRKVALLALVSLVVSHVVAVLIKKTFQRIRPYLALPNAMVHGHLFKDYSFPSGHTTAVFSIVISYLVVYPSLLPYLLPAALLVAVSRIVLGVHYPSDVLVGALLGTFTAITFSTFMF